MSRYYVGQILTKEEWTPFANYANSHNEEMLSGRANGDGTYTIYSYAPTEAEQAEKVRVARIEELKSLLTASDYKAIKHSEGWITDDEYAETKAQRQAYRDEINQLQGEE